MEYRALKKIELLTLHSAVILLLPYPLFADNLAVLAFPLLFWPAEFILTVIYTMFIIYAAGRIMRGINSASMLIFTIFIAAAGMPSGIIFTMLVSANPFTFRDTAIAAVTILPVLILSAACTILGITAVIRYFRNKQAGEHR